MDILCSEEEMPVLLDETFAMYDEYRLERALTWLAKNKGQVVIFTCQKREEQTLDRLGIPYHMVDLSRRTDVNEISAEHTARRNSSARW